MDTNNQSQTATAAPAAAAPTKGLPLWLKIVGVIVAVIMIFVILSRLLGGLGGGLFKKNEARKKKMAEVREGRSIARAEKREDRQDRKDMREQIRALKRERRNCKKATRGIKRKGGKRRAAKAECNKRFQEEVAKLRQDFKEQERSSDARLDGAFETDEEKATRNSGMGADSMDD